MALGGEHHAYAQAIATLCVSTALLTAAVGWLSYKLHALDQARRPTYPPFIVLVRHAESEGNVDVDAYRTIGDPLIPLTPRGHAQALAMAQRLRELVGDLRIWAFTSPYLRSRETAHIALSQFPPEVCRLAEDPRLREQEFAGGFQHSVPDRSEQRLYSKFFWRFPGGESAADVYDRLSMFMDTLWRDMHRIDLSGTAVVIFAHGLTNRLFCMRWLHWTPRVFERTRNPPNCGFIVLALQPADETGHPYYRLTPESVAVLGLPPDGLSLCAQLGDTELADPAESAPSSWARARLYSPQIDYSSLYASQVSKLKPPTIAGGSGWRAAGDWTSKSRSTSRQSSRATSPKSSGRPSLTSISSAGE
jgi:broad specificity phosphatase PhoE